MRKTTFQVAALLGAMSVVPVQMIAATYTVDFSKFGDGVDVTGKESVVQGEFAFVGNNSNATLKKGGFYTGGNSSATSRYITFTTKKAGTLTVQGNPSGDNTDRYIFVATEACADETKAVNGGKVAIPKKGTNASFSVDLEAGKTYYICLHGNGTINKVSYEEKASTFAIEADGTFYLKDVATGKFLGAGNKYGSQASLLTTGDPFEVKVSDGKYTFKGVLNNNGKQYLGKDAYCDQDVANYILEKDGNGWVMKLEGGKYMKADGNVLSNTGDDKETAAHWLFYKKAELVETLEDATYDSPADATWYIANPNFGRYNNTAAWTVSADCTNKNLDGGADENHCAESYHSTFKIYQNIKNVKPGLYKVSAQGFFRKDKGEDGTVPYFFANGSKQDFPEKTGTENSMADASASFSAGKYAVEFFVFVGEDGNLSLGVENVSNKNIWCIWDNFQLQYCGDIDVEGIKKELEVKLSVAINEAGDSKYSEDNDLKKFALDASELMSTVINLTAQQASDYKNNVPGNIGEQIATLQSNIKKAKANYDAYQKALDVHAKELTPALVPLDKAYSEAPEDVKAAVKSTYDNIKAQVAAFKTDAKAAYDKGYAAADNAAGIYTDANIKATVSSLTALITEATKSITDGSKDALNILAVKETVTAATTEYTTFASTLYGILAGNEKDGDIYADIYVKALAELNVSQRIIKEVSDAVNSATTLSDEKKDEYIQQLKGTYKPMQDVVVKYENMAKELRGNYEAACADVKTLNDKLDLAIKVIASDKKYKAVLDYYQSAINDILKGENTSIAALQNDVDEKNEAHEINTDQPPFYEGYNEAYKAIDNAISTLATKINKSVAETDANIEANKQIDELQTGYNTAKTAVKNMEVKAGETVRYAAAAQFGKTETDIQNDINAVKAAAAAAYKVDGTGSAMTFLKDLDLTAIQGSVDKYSGDAKANFEKASAVLAAYDNDTTAFANLKKVATNDLVTTDGHMGSETYGKYITDKEEAIQKIMTDFTAACAKKDAEHTAAMKALAVTDISGDIKVKADSYADNEKQWNKENIEAARDKMLAEATVRLEACNLPEADSYSAATYGKKAAELNTTLKELIDKKTGAVADVEKASKFEDEKAAEAVALLAETQKTITEIESGLAQLNNDAAAAKATYAKEVAANTQDGKDIANLKDQLNGNAGKKIKGVNDLLAGAADFSDEIMILNDTINSLEAAVKASFEAETLVKDNDDTKDESGKVTKKGYVSQIADILADIKDLQTKAVNEAENKAAYEALNKYIKDKKFDDAIVAAKKGIEIAEGEALVYYQAEIKKIEDEKAAIEKANMDAYNAKVKGTKYTDTEKNAKAVNSSLKVRVDNAIAAAKALTDAAKANNDARTAQVTKSSELKGERDKVFETITSSEASSAHEAAIKKIAEIDADIKAYNETVKENYGKGTCDTNKNDIEAKATAISNKIKELSDGWDDVYKAAVAADNAQRKQTFDGAYNILTSTYSDQLALISKLTKVSYAEEVNKEPLTGEDGFYKYAEAIRTLKSGVESSYKETVAPDLWDAEQKNTETAGEYLEAIKTKSQEYIDNVNAKANEVFAGQLKDAKDAYEVAVAQTIGFDESLFGPDGCPKALAPVKQLIDNAEMASKNSDFALNLDAILDQFAQINDMLAEGLDIAAGDQWQIELGAAQTLAESETDEIAEFLYNKNGEPVQGYYSKEYASFVEKNLEPLEGTEAVMATLGELRDELDDFNSTISGRLIGSKEQKHTAIYWKAYDADQKCKANDAAYTEVCGLIEEVEALNDNAAELLASMLVSHDKGLNIRLDNVDVELEDIQHFADLCHNQGTTLQNSTKLKNRINKQKDAVNLIVSDIIKAEHDNAELEITTLRVSDMEQAIAHNLETLSDETIEEWKNTLNGFDAYNERYYNDFINGKKDNDGMPVLDKDKNPVKATAEETRDLYVELEKQIGGMKELLKSYYEPKAVEEAVAKLENSLKTVQGIYDETKAKLNGTHDKVKEMFAEEMEDFEDAIKTIQENIKEAQADKTILLKAENIAADIAVVAEEYKDLASEIEEADKPFIVNDTKYAELKQELDGLQTRLDQVKAEIDAMERPMRTPEEIQERYDGIKKIIDYDRAKLEEKYADCELKEDSKNPNADYEAKDITYWERQIAHNDAISWCNSVKALFYDNEPVDGKYTPTDYEQLLQTWNDLNSKSEAVKKFADDGYWVKGTPVPSPYNHGVISYDIDGNPLEEPKDILDYYNEIYLPVMERCKLITSLAEQYNKDFEDKAYILGDVDHNGKVNVNDYNAVRNIVIGALADEDVTEAMKYAADVNADGMINIADVTMIANKIMYGKFNGQYGTWSKGLAPVLDTEEGISMQVSGTGAEQKVVVRLATAKAYVGSQMDIVLPQGVKLISATLGDAAEGLDLLVGEVDGVQRILISSIEGLQIATGENVLVELNVEVTPEYTEGGISIKNAMAADAKGFASSLNVLDKGTITGMKPLNAVQAARYKVVDVAGRLMNGLKSGLNIIVNEDGSTTKIAK